MVIQGPSVSPIDRPSLVCANPEKQEKNRNAESKSVFMDNGFNSLD